MEKAEYLAKCLDLIDNSIGGEKMVSGSHWANAKRLAEKELEEFRSRRGKFICTCCGEQAELKVCDCSFSNSPNYKILTRCCESDWNWFPEESGYIELED